MNLVTTQVLCPYEHDQFYELGFHDVLYGGTAMLEFEDVLDDICLKQLPPRVGLRLAVLWGTPYYAIQDLLSGANIGINEAGAHSDPLA